MGLETTPSSVASDGNLRVTYVPATSNPKSVAVLNGATAKPLTYSLTPGGLNRTSTEETINDERLAMRQLLTRAGTTTEGLELEYVYGDALDIARAALAKGITGFIVIRYSLANEIDYAVGQKDVDIVPIQAGKQRRNPPVRNGVQTMKQTFFVTGIVEENVTLVA